MALYTLKPWAQSRALIVNDDGIDAEGLAVLEGLARRHFKEVVIVAPSHEHSGMGHAISYKKEFKLHTRGDGRFAVDGTPADCTIVGLNIVMKDNPPDIVLSGINHGENAGNAITYSGTFGGAFEAGLAGIPAVAFSQIRLEDRSMDFSVARAYFGQVMDFLQQAPWPDHVVMNVNFPRFDGHESDKPHAAPVRSFHIVSNITAQDIGGGSHALNIAFKNGVSDQGSHHDLDVLARGGVTITPVSTNWTCHETLRLWTL